MAICSNEYLTFNIIAFPTDMTLKLVQITDTHLLADPTDVLRGDSPWASLQAVLTAITGTHPDVLLITGDIAEAGHSQAYEQLLQLVEPLGIPVYWVPGNHDNCLVMGNMFFHDQKATFPQLINLGVWQLILLDSVLPTAEFGEGRLTQNTLTWLQTVLKREGDRPTMIALHHHPVPTGIGWLDTIHLQNHNDFRSLVQQYPQVRCITFGHVHRALDHCDTHARYYGCPSTFSQVTSLTEAQHPQLLQPGFRCFALNPDGSYQTDVKRVERLPANSLYIKA